MTPQEQLELEAAAFRRLVAHLDSRKDVQNIDLMNLSGFCRNCLSKWYKAAADERQIDISLDDAREVVYGMPYAEWKAQYLQEARRRVLRAVRCGPWPRGGNRPSGHPAAMSTTQVVRPAGAGHETLYVLLLCLIILAVAGSVIALHGESQEVVAVPSHQLDARRDLSAAEQGIYADLRVTLDEIQLLQQEHSTLPPPEQLAEEGFAPFAQDASSVSRGNHRWQILEPSAYLGLSQVPSTSGSLLMRVHGAEPDIWLNRSANLAAPSDLSDQALIAAGWQQVVTQFDAGVTRQHRH